MIKLAAEFYFSVGTLPFSGTPKSKKIKRLAFAKSFNTKVKIPNFLRFVVFRQKIFGIELL